MKKMILVPDDTVWFYLPIELDLGDWWKPSNTANIGITMPEQKAVRLVNGLYIDSNYIISTKEAAENLLDNICDYFIEINDH